MSTIRDAIRDSSVFLVVATDNYARDFKKDDPFIKRQVDAMLLFPKRPVLIVYGPVISDANRKEMHEFFTRNFLAVAEMEYEYFGSKGKEALETLLR